MADETTLNDALKAKGFDSVDKVLEALESTKADLAKHKTRATELDDLKNRLQSFENEKAERENAAKTEAEKLADKVKALETEREQFKVEALNATRKAMLERGLGEHLGNVPGEIRQMAGKYLRTVLPTMDWTDPETLTAAIAAQLADLTVDAPDKFKPVVSGEGQTQKGGHPQPTPAENPNSLRNLLGKK